jgi:predicted RNA-binding Zn-ribbon protein involved in translation (DUF1610 family)
MKSLDSVREVFKTLKHRRASKIYCPRCGDSQISLSTSFDYWLTPKKYVCKKCGYAGQIVMELEKEE